MTALQLAFLPVTALDAVEAVRVLRNSGREWLFDQRYVSRAEQAVWWNAEPRRLWLAADGSSVVGFMHLQDKDGLTLVTLVVAPNLRSKGYGTEIYRRAPGLAGGPVHAAIWNRNSASIAAATRAGYRPVDAPGELVSLFRRDA